MSTTSETTFGDDLDGRDPDGSLSDDRQPGEAEGAVHLRRSINALNVTLKGLLESTEQMASKEYVEEWQREQERKRKRFVTLTIGVGTCMLVIMALMGATLYKVYDLAAGIDANTETVIDCTSPSIDPNSCYAERRAIQDASQAKETDKIIDNITNNIAQRVGDRVEEILKENQQP